MKGIAAEQPFIKDRILGNYFFKLNDHFIGKKLAFCTRFQEGVCLCLLRVAGILHRTDFETVQILSPYGRSQVAGLNQKARLRMLSASLP